jgi:hypothetical protein
VNSSAEVFVQTARKYVGYTSELLGRNSFGERVGYNTTVWSGAFIDVIARESGLDIPSFVYSPAALAEFLRNGQVVKTPRPGDIAIFNFASTSTHAASAFNSPHCGIVTDVRHLSTNGQFVTVEANTTGTQYQQQDGIYVKLRHLTDVVTFCRPATFNGPVRKLLAAARRSGLQLLTKVKRIFNQELKLELDQIQEAASLQPTVDIKMIRPATKNKQIAAVQLALSTVVDLIGAEQGKWDQVTASAFARFQRNIGRVGSDASGMPDLQTLQRLAKDTGMFQVS